MPKRSSPMMTSSKPATVDVFVSGLPQKMDKKSLAAFAAEYGAVGAKILFKSKGNTKNGFVHFTSIESAQFFIQAFNGVDVFHCGLTFVARFADGKNGEQKKVHFGMLSSDVTESDIFNTCLHYGQILTINRIFENSCCFVTFSNGQEAQACVDGLSRSGFEVSLARTNKRSASSSPSRAKKQRFVETTPLPVMNMNSPTCMSPVVETFSPVTQVIDENGNVFTTVQTITTERLSAERLSGCLPLPMVVSPLVALC